MDGSVDIWMPGITAAPKTTHIHPPTHTWYQLHLADPMQANLLTGNTDIEGPLSSDKCLSVLHSRKQKNKSTKLVYSLGAVTSKMEVKNNSNARTVVGW